MNIFVLDEDPILAAQYLCDKHIIKMAVESTQMMSTAMHYLAATPGPYKITHANHPCSAWIRLSWSNFLWHTIYTQSIFDEYYRRYGRYSEASPLVV